MELPYEIILRNLLIREIYYEMKLKERNILKEDKTLYGGKLSAVRQLIVDVEMNGGKVPQYYENAVESLMVSQVKCCDCNCELTEAMENREQDYTKQGRPQRMELPPRCFDCFGNHMREKKIQFSHKLGKWIKIKE